MNRWVIFQKTAVRLLLLLVVLQFSAFHPVSVRSQPTDLLVFAEAPSFARLNDVDPSGWFFQAILYNPTESEIAVTGLRWLYNASVKLFDAVRDARCYDTRVFSHPPTTYTQNDDSIWWEYAPGNISIPLASKDVVSPWIEVPTNSVNDDSIPATYRVQAYVDGIWVSSPLYLSHSGYIKDVSTVFRADFDLTTDPDDEQHEVHPNPEWLFREDRFAAANLSTKVRVIPVASSRDASGIDYATINVTLPLDWDYVGGTASNPHNETVDHHAVGGYDTLQWQLDKDVRVYSQNQSMSQNYLEFNVTAPYVLGIYNFTVTAIVTSTDGRTTSENQHIYAVVKFRPNAEFTSSHTSLLTYEDVSFDAAVSYDNDGYVASYFWDFGDGNTGTGNVTTHRFTDDGLYNVTLLVSDNDGLTDTARVAITVHNRLPVARFTKSAEQVATGVPIYFNASGSYDWDGYVATYFWDFGDGTYGLGILTSHAYSEDGSYTAELIAIDDDGASATAADATMILNQAPVASFVVTSARTVVGEAVAFDASSSLDADGRILTYSWDFGDGYIAVVTRSLVTHNFETSGNYVVTLEVTDNDDAQNSSSLGLHVHSVDIAIVGATVSAAVVPVGQEVNISVVVRNEGTALETFHVTLYCGETALGTQIVTDLEPSAETVLTFQWDTTDAGSGVTYTLKAMISDLFGERDTADNAYTCGTVSVESQVGPGSSWGLMLYLIPLVLGILTLSTVGVVRTKRNKGQDFWFFDELTGGLSEVNSVMVVGGADSGKSVLCQQLAYQHVKQGKPCIYVSYDTFPSAVREHMKHFRWDVSQYEERGTFKFVDAYSGWGSLDSGEEYCVKKPLALTDLASTIATAMNDAPQRSARVFLDSTAPLFVHLKTAQVADFLQNQIAGIKRNNGLFIFTVREGTIPMNHKLSEVVEIVDCIIELDVNKRMRVRKLRGREVDDAWTSFKIEPRKGIVFFPPKDWTNPPRS
jgi:KaiC/GvpD/RAD55 family RecA-like ATPase/chitodextrinase